MARSSERVFAALGAVFALSLGGAVSGQEVA